MHWTVFWNTLRHSWVMTLVWGVGLGAFVTFFVLITPMLTGLELVELFQSMPPALMAAAGVRDAAVLGSPEGLIAVGFFGKFALIFAAYPVIMGIRATLHEENAGTMDVLMSLPLARSRFVFEKFLAYSLNIIVLVLLVLGGLYAGLPFVDMEFDAARVTLVTLALIPSLIFVLALTIFVASITSRRVLVIGIMTAFVMGSFMIQTIGGMVTTDWMALLERFSFFSYYNVENIITNGVVVSHVIGLLVVAALLLGGSLYSFERRDIAA